MFYEDPTRTIKQNPASCTIICGDFNAKIELKSDPSEVALGNFGSLNRNTYGKMLLNFLLEHDFYQMKSLFQKKEHRRWTWKSGRTRNEIDYFIADIKYIFKSTSISTF